MLSCTTDAKEDRYVLVTDIPSTFLHADMEGKVHMLQEADISELIFRLEPSKHETYIWYNQKSKPMLYVQEKALHGKLQEELLFWKIIIRHITGVGFKINKYNQCVASETIIWQTMYHSMACR